MIPFAAIVLVLTIGAAFLYTLARFGKTPAPPALHLLGGASGTSLEADRLWTLVASGLLHANAWHVSLNLVSLAVVAAAVELVWGGRVMFAVFTLATITGATASAVVDPDLVLVGSSGGIFGLTAYALTRLAWSGEYAVGERRALVATSVVGALLALDLHAQLLGDVPRHFASLPAHIGGAAGGIVLALLMRPIRARRPVTWASSGVTVAAASLVVVGASGPIAASAPASWTPDPAEEQRPGTRVVEQALDRVALMQIGIVRNPKCEHVRQRPLIKCAVRIGDSPRQRTLWVDSSLPHLQLLGAFDADPEQVERAVESNGIVTDVTCVSEGALQVNCAGWRTSQLPVSIDVDFRDSFVEPHEEVDENRSGELAASLVGAKVGSGALRLDRARCAGAEPGQAATCFGTYLGRGYNVLAGGAVDLDLAPRAYVLWNAGAIAHRVPTTATDAERALRYIEFRYDPDPVTLRARPGSTRARRADCTTGPDEALIRWSCDMKFDDGTSGVMEFKFNHYLPTLHAVRPNAFDEAGPDGQFYDGPSPVGAHPPPDIDAAARSRPTPTQLEGMLERLSYSSEQPEQVDVRGARCERAKTESTLDPYYGCTITFRGGEVQRHRVDVFHGRIYSTPSEPLPRELEYTHGGLR